MLYAMDRRWWRVHEKEVKATFAGTLVSGSRGSFGAEYSGVKAKNSGMGAILYAYEKLGAERIILLGFDAQPTGGQHHWHGDHPKPLNNPSAYDRWQKEFAEAAKATDSIEIVNASRETALAFWPRVDLAGALNTEIRRAPVIVNGMHGIGDTLHERAVVRELAANCDVWVRTPFPSLFWDMPDVRVLRKHSDLPPQARNEAQEADLFAADEPPRAREIRIRYDREGVKRHGSVLGAMCANAGVAKGDFRLEPKPEWLAEADVLITGWRPDRPIMLYRPLIERPQHRFCAKRNPDHNAYTQIVAAIRERFFVVSIADSTTERIVCPGVVPDVDLADGRLTMTQIYGLMARADLAFGPVSFATILAQALGTPGVTVFGGFEDSRSFADGGGKLTPWLGIDPIRPCQCWGARHRCDKRIDVPAAIERIEQFIEEHVVEDAYRRAETRRTA